MKDTSLNGRVHTVPLSIGTDLDVDVETSKGEHVLSVRDPLRVLWRRLWVIILVAILFAGVAVWYSLSQVPTYKASMKILIGQEMANMPDNFVPNPAGLSGEVQGLREIAQTMASAVKTRPVAEDTIARLGLQMSPEGLLGNLDAKRAGETQFIEVSYEDSNPKRTQEVVNTIGYVFSEQVSETSASTNTISATVWEKAALPGSPVSPNPERNGALGFVLGCILGIVLALLLEHLDNRWRSVEEVEQVSGVPAFGVIPEFKIPRVSNSEKRALDSEKKGEY